MTSARRHPWRISDFLTDGSLAALMEQLSEMTGAELSLHDVDGGRVRTADGAAPWTIETGGARGARVARWLAGEHDASDDNGLIVAPITVNGEVIGGIACDSNALPEDEHRAAAVAVLSLVAHTAEEFCRENIDKTRRTEELAMLFRLSTALVAPRSLTDAMELALRTALELTGADAGAAHLLDEDRDDTLDLVAHVGVAPAVAEALAHLPAREVIDQDVLRGDAFEVEDLAADGRAIALDVLLADGLTGMLSVGLIFRARPLGVLRLYRRCPAGEPNGFGRREHLLARSVAEQMAAAAAGVRAVEADRRRRQIEGALALASSVQRRMLPARLPATDRLDFAWKYEPSFELGGDFVDLIEFKNAVGLAVGDVVGKGVPAALLMAAVRASLRAHANTLYHVDEIMRLVNSAVTRDTRDNEFATIFYGVIDLRSLRLTYCNAGHDFPIIIRRSGELITLDTSGLVVGVVGDFPYERSIFDLEPGDILIANTDGVTDAQNFDDEKFGRDRLLASLAAILDERPDASADAIANHVLWDVRRFVGLRPKIDDFTLLAVRVLR